MQTLSTSLATMKSEAEGLLKQLSQGMKHFIFLKITTVTFLIFRSFSCYPLQPNITVPSWKLN